MSATRGRGTRSGSACDATRRACTPAARAPEGAEHPPLQGRSRTERDILYTSEPAGPGTGPDIWGMRPDGSAPLPPTVHPRVIDNIPVWSPDGGRIAFVSNRDWAEGLALYTMNPDGSNVQQLGPQEWSTLAFPEWSPDGTRIVFTADLADETQLKVLDPRVRNQPRLRSQPVRLVRGLHDERSTART